MFAEALPELSPFQGLEDAQIQELSSWLTRVEFPADHVVFTEHSSLDGLYVLVRGQVSVIKTSGGRNMVLAELEAPSVFGEMALLTHQNHSATVRTRTPVTAGLLPYEIFELRIRQNNVTALRIAFNLGRIACHRLRMATRDLLRLAEYAPADVASNGVHRTEDLLEHCTRILKEQAKER